MRSIYRKEPILAFGITVGAVDAAIGGFSEHYGLLAVGLTTVGAAIALRLWLQQQRPLPEPPQRKAAYLLPDKSSSSSLPMLSIPKKNPPSRPR
jgi:hypothetical protein